MGSNSIGIFENASQSVSLKKESVPNSIMNLITDYLLSKKLKPGDQLPTEQELMSMLGVGRNSVREGIKMLTTLGVVEIRKGIGSFVSSSIPSSAMNPLVLSLLFEQGLSLNLVELRVLIDNGVGELVIEKASDADIAALESINEQIQNVATTHVNAGKELKELDLQFHSKMFEIADNPLITKVGFTIYKLFNVAMENSMVASPVTAYRNHLMIINSIKQKDRLLLRDSVKNSLVVWSQFINGQK
ncbi:MAG: hypothetical protein CVV52_09240 [Spirochaetae bacterium HGW-Spirochaetae-8]|nr:MAG: hypothetical protein CVV52_09240 [Spirochaetae bacterium HGW-Spirochaetae-8]